jgi:hypothetical protein
MVVRAAGKMHNVGLRFFFSTGKTAQTMEIYLRIDNDLLCGDKICQLMPAYSAQAALLKKVGTKLLAATVGFKHSKRINAALFNSTPHRVKNLNKAT